MRKIQLLLGILMISSVSSILPAQNAKLDSLLNLLDQYPKEDTVRVNLLNDVATVFLIGDLEKSITYTKEALQLAEKFNFKKGKANSLYILGRYYNNKSDFPKALSHYQKSLKISEEIDSKREIAQNLNRIGIIYKIQGSYSIAQDYYLKSLLISEQIGDKQSIANCLFWIGMIYRINGNFNDALRFLQKSLMIREEMGDNLGIANSLHNIGNVHEKQYNFPLAHEFYQKSLKMFEEEGDKVGIARLLINIGNLYEKQGNYPTAHGNYQIALKLYKKTGNKYGISLGYFNLGSIYLKKLNYSKALDYTLKSLRIAKEIETLYFIGEVYRQLSEIYTAVHNYKKAYENYVFYRQFEDSVFNEENIKKMAVLEHQYKFDKEKQAIKLEQEKKDVLLAEEAKRQSIIRNFLIAGFILMVLLVLLVWRSLFQRRKANNLLRTQKEEITSALAQLKKLNEELSTNKEELIQTNDELKNQSKELRQSREEAQAASKSKSVFLANMSHEIRTPMNAILGFTQIIKSRIKKANFDKVELARFLETIHSSAKSLLSLINDILDLSKVEAGKLAMEYAPISPKKLFNDIHNIFRQKIIDKGLKFIVEVAPDLPKVLLLDEVRLRQILINLIGNSIRFTKAGHIKISVSHLYPDESTCSELDLILSVQDSGVGISKDHYESIFESFSQAEGQKLATFGGTGLGLAICRRLVEMMGGKISVSSELGKGSTFKIVIKDVEVPLDATLIEQKDQVLDFEEIKFKQCTVLIADDIEYNRELILGLLEEQDNITFLKAVNGKEVIEKAREHHPDLVLLDMKMPVMDGYEAAGILQKEKKLKEIPIIAVTASAMKEDEERIRKLCHSYLQKPVGKSELVLEMMKFLPHTITSKQEPDTHPIETEAIIPPTVDKLKELYELGLDGNMDRIIEYLDELVQKDEKLNRFCDQFRTLALGFRDEEIITLLEEILSKEEKDAEKPNETV